MQRMRNSHIFYFVFSLAIWLAVGVFPQESFADTSIIPTAAPTSIGIDTKQCPNQPVETVTTTDSAGNQVTTTILQANQCVICPTNYKGLVVKIVPCIRGTILYAATQIFVPLSTFVAKIVTILSTLAIVFFGIKLTAGQAGIITKEGMILAIKIACVGLFTGYYPALYPKMVAVIEDLLNMVATPAINMITVNATCAGHNSFTGDDAKIMQIFGALDCYLDSLVGGIFDPPSTAYTAQTLKNGLIGFLVSLAFTGAAGFFIGAIGLFLVFISLKTIAQTIFIFLQGFLAFSLMIIISPLFVPLILFKATQEKYFNTWADTTIGFIVQPVLVLGYLVMFILAFNTCIFTGTNSLYFAIAGSASNNKDFKMGQWMNDNHIFVKDSKNAQGITMDAKGALKELGTPENNNKGEKSELAWDKIPDSAFADIFGDMGVGRAGKALNFFKTDTPIQDVDILALAKATNTAGAADDDKVRAYKLKIFLSFMMSLIVVYIFHELLDYLPFIGSGLMSKTATSGKQLALGSDSSKQNALRNGMRKG